MISYLEMAKKALGDDNLQTGPSLAKLQEVPYTAQEPSPVAFELLTWASHLVEQDLVLTETISYVEARLRTISTTRVSQHAARHLRTITSARIQQETGGWGLWTPEWWREREEEALGALANLRQAMRDRQVAKA